MIDEVVDVVGDVSVNVRKGRVRQVYDLEISLKYKSNGASLKIVDYMSDTDRKNFEVVCPHNMNSEDKMLICDGLWERLSIFREELESIQGSPLLIQSCSTSTTTSESSFKCPDSSNINTRTLSNDTSTSQDGRIDSNHASGTFMDTINFAAPQTSVFDALTMPEMISAWSRGTSSFKSHPNARLSVGESYTILGGNILAHIKEIKSPDLLALEWTLRSWESSQPSKAIIKITSDNSGSSCKVRIEHRGIPSGEVDNVKSNWYRYYWDPIRMLLGCPPAP